ncbi:DUF4132 domain-containing protein [Actinomadura rubrisoli]|uniref:DUF4132 domain-containing protein n=1 Tax=Actinomadura rubrisoli TaxID=2530368 RepID=A0A4R5C6T4_9ACTN|nr:DUF4132 domain-containing protein [Actinomadura rubrisoli]TDD94785.1 DUF4132 domain-containing protein [Actinomadura rubrisoli]
MDDQLSPLPDEDALTLPDAWRRSLHARRGGAPGPKIKVDAAAPRAARSLIEETGGAVASLLRGEHGDLELTGAARRYLDGADDPAGAAAVAAVTEMGVGQRRREEVNRTFVDSWVVEHGIAFAACALVELSRTEGSRRAGGDWIGTWVGAVHRELDDLNPASPEAMRRVRGLLAVADEPDYAEAVKRLEAHRSTWATRWLVSYLVPTREDWVDECCAADVAHPRGTAQRWLALSSLGRADQFANAYIGRGLSWGNATRALLTTIVDGAGAGALPYLLDNADDTYIEAADRKRIFETVAVMPTDEAFQALLDRLDRKHARPALLEAMKRFPVRALRLLAAAGSAETAALLADHVRAHAEVVAAALPGLPDETRAVIEPIANAAAPVPEAAPGEVPSLLRAPAWRSPRRPVVPGLTAPAPAMAWAEGERQTWLTGDPKVEEPASADWEMLVEGYKNGGPQTGSVQLMVYGPEELIRPLLAGFQGFARPWAHTWTRVLAAKYELDALPVALLMAKAGPDTCYPPLLPFLDARVATLAADWLLSGGQRQTGGRAWLDRHGLAAVPLLVPAALGKTAKPSRTAENALRHLSSAHGRAAVVDAARAVHGDEAAAALDELLSTHPAGTGLAGPPKIGDWVDPAVLPQVLLRGRERALPAETTPNLVEFLALPDPFGLEEVREACDPESLAEFGWALFQKWRDAGNPSKDGWALAQLGRSGDDETVRRLTPVIRAWPGEGGHRYAVTGLGVLAGIGSDVALMHLHGIAQKVKFKALKAEAQRRIEEVAGHLGLSTEQLADRLVPGFGLDADGSLTLDYGPRRFTVTFDEQLKPVVADEDGKRRKALPSPGAKDDPELAPAAHRAFAALKKDVRTVASDQLHRLERAMVTQRRWTTDEFRRFIVDHPLMWHLARRLVWIAEDGDKASSFRIAEDRTYADAGDDPFALPESARVGIAHPLHLGDAVGTWSEVFADYEILQPFPQLGRAVHALTDEERASGRLARFEKLKVPFGKVLGLVKLGWERGVPLDAGGERWISRRVADDRYVVIDLDPGIAVGAVDATGDHQTLDYVWFATEPDDYRPSRGTPLRFGELDRVTASEVIADLTTLAEAAV